MTQKENTVSISIASIQETDFSYKSDYDYSKVKANNLKLKLNRSFQVDMEKELLGIKVFLSYNHNETELMKLEVLMNFNISNINEVIEPTEKGLNVKNDNLVDNLVNIVISSLRGILYVKVKDTPLEKYPLPLFSSHARKNSQ